jgi:hypothetical protein
VLALIVEGIARHGCSLAGNRSKTRTNSGTRSIPNLRLSLGAHAEP